MDFLTSQPDLTQTIYTESDLLAARVYLKTWIQREKSTWLKNPQGPLGEYWRADDAMSACHLIDLACMLEAVTSKVTSPSVPRLHKKVRENLLPRPADIKKFYETLAELQVAFKLINYASRLTLEPPIPNQRRAPDIAFQLPEGIFYWDVTIFHGGPLERWADATEKIKKALEQRIIKRKKALNVNIQIPFETIKVDAIIKQVLDGINEGDTGEVAVGSKGLIKWEPFPILEVQDELFIPEMPSFAGAYHTVGASADIAFGSQSTMAVPSPEDSKKANESFLRSVRTKLREKQDQFPPNQPSFYVMKLGHWMMSPEIMLNIIQTDIWKKDDYRWITGIILFTPRQSFLPTDNDAQWVLSLNPRAKCKENASLVSIFRDEAQFHY